MINARPGMSMAPQLIQSPSAEAMKALCFTRWMLEHIREDKVIDREFVRNIVTSEGLNNLLDVHFAAGTQISTWYIILWENDYTPVAGDTYATHGWTETQSYDETTRPVWSPGTIASGSVDNSASKATFTFNASKTIYGGAILGGGTNPSQKFNTAGGGTVYAAVRFAASKAVVATDVIKITATITAADDPS
jgi:hypothetical protein